MKSLLLCKGPWPCVVILLLSGRNQPLIDESQAADMKHPINGHLLFLWALFIICWNGEESEAVISLIDELQHPYIICRLNKKKGDVGVLLEGLSSFCICIMSCKNVGRAWTSCACCTQIWTLTLFFFFFWGLMRVIRLLNSRLRFWFCS